MGRDKDTDMIVASYSGDLAVAHGRETRNLISSKPYQNIFKETSLAPDSKAKGTWNTTGKGAYNAAGVGGSITGKGAKIFIIDDPFKDRKEVESVIIRDDRDSWRKSVARTRLTPDGAMVILHTRWHDDDMIGRIVADGDFIDFFEWEKLFEAGEAIPKTWVRMTLPAIAEHDEPFRQSGEALWPGRYDLKELDLIKRDLGGYEWSALYQQSPVDDEHRVFHPDWFQYRDVEEVDKLNTTNFMTIDTKGTERRDAGSDYIGITVNHVENSGQWNFRSWRDRMSSKELVDFLFTAHIKYRLAKIGIEKTSFTEGLEVYLNEEMAKRNHYLPIVQLKHGGTKKEIRIEALQPRYERGAIYHVREYGQNTCADLEEELLRFPKAINDDASDSAAYQMQVVQAVNVLDNDEEELAIYA